MGSKTASTKDSPETSRKVIGDGQDEGVAVLFEKKFLNLLVRRASRALKSSIY